MITDFVYEKHTQAHNITSPLSSETLLSPKKPAKSLNQKPKKLTITKSASGNLKRILLLIRVKTLFQKVSFRLKIDVVLPGLSTA